MFQFSREDSWKGVLTATTAIKPDHTSNPMVWTPGLKEFETRQVFLVCTKTAQNGRGSMRFYPLPKRTDRYPPCLVLVPLDHPLLNEKGTHVVYRHANFLIVRPLKAVFHKAQWALKRQELDWLPQNLLTLVKHCYFQDLITDRVLEVAEKRFERLGNLLALANHNSNEAEARNATKHALRLCGKLLKIIRKEVGLE